MPIFYDILLYLEMTKLHLTHIGVIRVKNEIFLGGMAVNTEFDKNQEFCGNLW